MKISDEILYRPHGVGLDTGHYQLIAVVTHKGRSADGGHYVGWVHKSGDDWYCYDDDIVTSVKTDEILALRGGGDWHTAYLCIYRKLEVTK
jgi:ubiquitin carboxyl-terminal hydrolase 14